MPIITSKNAFAGGAPSASFADTMLSKNPTSWWRYGESVGTTAVDEIQAINGTYGGTFNLGEPGLITGDPNTSVEFLSGNVDHGSDAGIDDIFGATGGSIVIWCRPNSLISTEALVAKRNQTTNGFIFFLTDESGNAWRIRLFQFFSSANGAWQTTGRPVQLNQTSMVSVSYQGGAAFDPIIYHNGVAVPITETDTPAGSFRGDQAFPLRTAEDTDGTLDFFGFLDEFAIWNNLNPTKLTAQDHLDIYNAGT